MISIVMPKNRQFLVTDAHFEGNRGLRYLSFWIASRFGIADLVILLVSIFPPLNLPTMVTIILVVLLILSIVATYYSYQALPMSIGGMLVTLDENNDPEYLAVRYWLQGSVEKLQENEVRFNQAIGFKAILQDDDSIIIEIIVDPDVPGTAIFHVSYFDSLAQTIKFLGKAFPDHTAWIYRLPNGEDWTSEDKEELNEAMSLTPLDIETIKYFKFN